MSRIRIAIITIGNEILRGRTLNTNAHYLARWANRFGIEVCRMCTVPDDKRAIHAALNDAYGCADWAICTGGLGPTTDDITRQAIAEYFDLPLEYREDVQARIEEFLRHFGIPFEAKHRSLCYVPQGALVFYNRKGTAPGFLIDRGGRVLVALPGVPIEMRHLVEDYLTPYVQQRYGYRPLPSERILLAGIEEPEVYRRVETLIDETATFIDWGFYPHYTNVEITLRMRPDVGVAPAEVEERLRKLRYRIEELFGADYVGSGDVSLGRAAGAYLKQLGWYAGAAESCTGGYISHLFTSDAGSSEYFKGAIVSYANAVKHEVLGVPMEVLKAEGAVSQPVVEAMVRGALRVLDVGVAVAVNGIAGPGGGTPEKPVGTVWIAVGDHSEVRSRRFHFPYDRLENIEITAITALDVLRRWCRARIYKSPLPWT